MEALENIRNIKNNWKLHSRWERRQLEDEQCFDVLKNGQNITPEEISYSQKRGRIIADAVNIMDQSAINKSQNAMISIKTALSAAGTVFGLVGLGVGYLCSALSKSQKKTPKMSAFIGYSIFSLIGMAFINFVNAHFEKKATRIARFQIRNSLMKDVNNFAVYDDDQIKRAEKLAETMPEVKDITDDMSMKESLNPIKAFKKSFEAVRSIKKDYADYKKWHAEYIEKEKKKPELQKNVVLSPAEQEKAEKDKNQILKNVRKLEIGSNIYEINFNLGVKIAAILASLAGVGGGFVGSWLLGRLSTKASVNSKMAKCLNYLSKLSVPAGIAGLFLFLGPLTKLSKDSAKIGRFKENEKLFSSDRNFLPHTDAQIREIREKRKFHHKHHSLIDAVKRDISDVINMKNDFVSFNEYKKKKLPEELKIKEALKTMPLSEKQFQEAKKIQQQLFMAFEKIDDKTESFVDDTVAFTNVASNLITGTACTLANIVTLKLFGNQISKFTDKKNMPGFFEGLKLCKHLSLKNLSLIFILPFALTRGIIFLTSLASAEIQKKACKIGIMSAVKDLDNPKNFVFNDKNNSPDALSAVFNKFKQN